MEIKLLKFKNKNKKSDNKHNPYNYEQYILLATFSTTEMFVQLVQRK